MCLYGYTHTRTLLPLKRLIPLMGWDGSFSLPHDDVHDEGQEMVYMIMMIMWTYLHRDLRFWRGYLMVNRQADEVEAFE